jgi:2-methylisocitrate lyase-like PEP mutase family enzyme
MTAATEFRALHQNRAAGDPLVLASPWDVASAQMLADVGYRALATPSIGIAASLGYRDGATPVDEMFAAVSRIAQAVTVPVSADLEDGYGLTPRELIERLTESGAVGCNLEDSAHGVLKDARKHADWLAEVRAQAGANVFINARVDTYLYGEGDTADAIERACLYIEAGADCVFPLSAPLEAVPALREAIASPINLAAKARKNSVTKLAHLGVTRITFGPEMQREAMWSIGALAAEIRS